MSQLIQETILDVEQVEIKSHRWVTLEEQEEWIQFLKDVNLGAIKEVTEEKGLGFCGSVVRKFHCQMNHDHAIHTNYMLCGNRSMCPRCAMSYSSKKANAQFLYLKENFAKSLPFDVKLNQIVLTLPQKLHSVEKKSFTKAIHSFMKKMGIQAYGYVIQNSHSKDPLSAEYVHAHCVTLNVKEQDDYIVQNDYFFDLDEMRKTWKSVIGETLDFELGSGEDINLHTEYASIMNNPQKVKHILKYLYRYPIEDLFNVQVRNKSLNYVQKGHFKNCEKNVYDLLKTRKSNFVWSGLLASGKRKYLTKLLEMPHRFWQNLKFFEKQLEIRSKQCRDCGMPLEEKPFETSAYNGDNEPELYKPPLLFH
jgi:hypothetical protein